MTGDMSVEGLLAVISLADKNHKKKHNHMPTLDKTVQHCYELVLRKKEKERKEKVNRNLNTIKPLDL